MPTLQALIIDDDNTVRDMATSAMPGRGIKVWSAANTLEADKILREEKVDVIICDVMMLQEDGLSYCKRLREAGNTTPFIFISSLGDPTTQRIGAISGATAFIVKPFDIAELCELIAKLALPPTSLPPAV